MLDNIFNHSKIVQTKLAKKKAFKPKNNTVNKILLKYAVCSQSGFFTLAENLHFYTDIAFGVCDRRYRRDPANPKFGYCVSQFSRSRSRNHVF